MAETDIVQVITETRVDARSLSDFVFKPADFMVQRRLAPPINTLNFYIELFKKVASDGVRDINQAIINSGFVTVDSFEIGATITQRNQALRHTATGKLYRWGGSLPKVVAASSTPTSSGGTSANAWIEVSDAALRQQLSTTNGAELVGVDIDASYPVGTVGNRLARKAISGGEFLPTLTSVNDSGRYRVANLDDTAGFNGTVDVNLYLSGGNLYGSAEITSYSNVPARKSIATCTAGVWSDWQEVAMQSDIPIGDILTDNYNLNGITPIKKDKKFAVCKGGYSWWAEPQSCQVGGVFQKTVIGSVDAVEGTVKTVVIDASKNTFPISEGVLKTASEYIPDEHNAPVTIEVKGKIITFNHGHNDVGYLPYRVGQEGDPTKLGAEKQIAAPSGTVSYTQAFYDKTLDKLVVAFRAGGDNGNGRTWYLATSDDWDAEIPVWTVNALFTHTTDLMYIRAVPNAASGVVRFLVTKNATYTATNGIWFAYLNLVDNKMRTTQSVQVGVLGEGAVNIDSLTKIYDAPARIRLYDAASNTTKIPMLLQTFTSGSGSAYRYVEFTLSGWSITKDIEIVHSGKELAPNTTYFGGAHFSNNTGFSLGGAITYQVYVAREQSGTYYIERYKSADNGTTWALDEVIDSSATDKMWRPRVPFNTDVKPSPNQVILTWCKGSWTSFLDYDSTIWALKK